MILLIWKKRAKEKDGGEFHVVRKKKKRRLGESKTIKNKKKKRIKIDKAGRKVKIITINNNITLNPKRHNSKAFNGWVITCLLL